MTTKKDDALATTATGVMARPSFIPTERVGFEHVTRDDMKIPRLQIAQALSPEVQETEPGTYIEGLRVGMLFNDLTREVFGKERIPFWIVRADPAHWVEFNPREEGGGVRDPHVPFGDARTMPDAMGNTVATKFYDFIIMMTRKGKTEPIALSLKGKSGERAAKTLIGLGSMQQAPCYAINYFVTPGMVKNTKGTFAVYQFSYDEANLWPASQEEYDARTQLFEDYKDKPLEINRDDDVSFDPATLEAKAEM